MLSLLFKGMTKDDITQGFHQNHGGWDLVEHSTARGKLYGTPLCAPEDCLVLYINGDGFTPNSNEHLANGYGIKLRGKETGLEYLFWHCLPIFPVWGGDSVKRGQIVAYMGNAGYVTVGGKLVPIEERTTDPEPGTHLHLEVYKKGFQIDPVSLFNWDLQPQYGTSDIIKAALVVAQKIIKRIK